MATALMTTMKVTVMMTMTTVTQTKDSACKILVTFEWATGSSRS